MATIRMPCAGFILKMIFGRYNSACAAFDPVCAYVLGRSFAAAMHTSEAYPFPSLLSRLPSSPVP